MLLIDIVEEDMMVTGGVGDCSRSALVTAPNKTNQKHGDPKTEGKLEGR